MSTHEDRKVHRVTSEADARIRAYAREKGITAFDAASMWQPPAEPSEHGAESSAPTVEPAHPEVLAYAERKGISPADALAKLLDLGVKRARALDNYKAAK